MGRGKKKKIWAKALKAGKAPKLSHSTHLLIDQHETEHEKTYSQGAQTLCICGTFRIEYLITSAHGAQ